MSKRKQPTPHLGNRELRRHHAVMIEPGVVPRAKILDQHIVDRYLMEGLINLTQHRAAERLLEQASIAGVWAKGVDWGKATSRGKPNYVPFGAFPLGRSFVRIRKRFGDYHQYITREVIVFNADVSGNEYNMQCLKDSLDWIANNGPNKLKMLKAAAKN